MSYYGKCAIKVIIIIVSIIIIIIIIILIMINCTQMRQMF